MRNSSRGHTRQCRAAENAIAVGVRRLQMEAQEEDHEQRSAHGKRQIVNLTNGVLHVEGTKGATPPPLIIADKYIARASPPTFLQSINPINWCLQHCTVEGPATARMSILVKSRFRLPITRAQRIERRGDTPS